MPQEHSKSINDDDFTHFMMRVLQRSTMPPREVIDLTNDDEPPARVKSRTQVQQPGQPGQPSELRDGTEVRHLSRNQFPYGPSMLLPQNIARGKASQQETNQSGKPLTLGYRSEERYLGQTVRTPPTHQLISDIPQMRLVPQTRPVRTPTKTQTSKVNKNQCFSCFELGIPCDGQYPCAACYEPGVPCDYPGQKRQTPKSAGSQSASHHISPPTPPTIINGESRKGAIASLAQKLSLSSEIVESVSARENEATAMHAWETSSEESEDEYPRFNAPAVASTYFEVKEILKKHEKRMRESREAMIKPLLQKATIHATKSTGLLLNTKRPHPFASLIAQEEARKDAHFTASPGAIQIQYKSFRNGAPKKYNTMYVQPKRDSSESDKTLLPKYKSIGRLGMSFLAPNIRTLKYWPYFADEEDTDMQKDERHRELEEQYKVDDVNLLAQRKCQELISMWKPWIGDFLQNLGVPVQDMMFFLLRTTPDGHMECRMCHQDPGDINIFELLSKPADGQMLLEANCAHAVQDITGIHMWHFIVEQPEIKDLIKLSQISRDSQNPTTLCSVCYLHNCLTHGAYIEDVLEDTGKPVTINDDEAGINFRQMAAIPNVKKAAKHQCGFLCIPDAFPPQNEPVPLIALWGKRADGRIGGRKNPKFPPRKSPFADESECSKDCFWHVQNRTKHQHVLQAQPPNKITEKDRKLFASLLPLYSASQRAPCMIAQLMRLPCNEIFYFMLSEIYSKSHDILDLPIQTTQSQASLSLVQLQGGRKTSKLVAGLDTSRTADLDARPAFVPCSHDGPCQNNPDCTCADDKVHCEWFCGCDKSCKRRFTGCNCTGKTCFNDMRCECWANNRECDPWLCGKCGVIEVLASSNKYKEEIRQGRCKNNRLQLDLPARTVKAPSEVQGWGLYAGEDLDENSFVGEYKGETVSNPESDRRGVVYHNIGQEYLFVMNRDQQIDGSNFGNKTRFINNSQRDEYINVQAKKMLCNGVQRVMLFTKRPIKAGEELLYNYNYPEHVVKHFWEPGEGPTNKVGVVKPLIDCGSTGRFAKSVVSKQTGEEPRMKKSVQEDIIWREKRKRDEEMIDVPHPLMIMPKEVNAPKAGEDSDYEEELIQSEHSESPDVEETSSEENNIRKSTRQRQIHAGDRRQGGAAQRRAWATRKRKA